MPSVFPPSFPPPYRNNPEDNGPAPLKIRIARAKLAEDWYTCEVSLANLLQWGRHPEDPSKDQLFISSDQVLLRDPIGMIEWNLASLQDADGDWYLPKGMTLVVWQPEDAKDSHWEVLQVGEVCPAALGSTDQGGSGSTPDRKRECDSGKVPPCPGSGLYVLACRNGECATWQPLAQDDDSQYMLKPTATGTILLPPAVAIGEAWLDATDSSQYPIIRVRQY